MTYDTDQRSTSGSRPIELYTIQAPSGTYHTTSHNVNVEFGGITFDATTMEREEQHVAQDMAGKETRFALPITHPIVQRFAAFGIPEREVLVTITRLQEVSGETELQWSGVVNGMSIDGKLAYFRSPSVTDDAMRVTLPVLRAQRSCNHVLFDPQCKISRNDIRFHVDTNIVSVDGTSIVVVSIGDKAADFAAPTGEFFHLATGERRQVLAQSGTLFNINAPFIGMAVGDFVQIFADCAHTIVDCRDKFDNVINFGGFPRMNAVINPWTFAGLGIVQ